MVRVLVLLAACRPDPTSDRPVESRQHLPADTTPVPDTGAPDSVLDSAAIDPCAGVVLATDVSSTSTAAIRSRGDFDFDVDGFLDSSWNQDLVAYSRSGDRHRLAVDVGYEPSAIRSLPSGDLVVAMPYSGALKVVRYETGESSTVVGGLTWPQGLEVGADGLVYVSEYTQNGTVRRIDPYTGESEVVARLPYPSALALSPDEQTLYVSSAGSYEGSPIAAVDRAPEGGWNPTPRRIWDAQGPIDSLATDVCGNLYVAEVTGRVFRIRLEDGGFDPIANLAVGPYGIVAARFGNGRGEFSRDQLFVSNRTELFILDIGIDGRHVLAD